MGGGGTDLLSHSYGVKAIWSDRYQVPEFQSALNALPRSVRQKEFEYGIYEFVAAAPRADVWFDLDVGTRDDLHVLRFRAKETSEGRTFRWTGPASAISVTSMLPGAREVTLVMSDGGRPPAAPVADVEVFLHNQLLGRIEVEGRRSAPTRWRFRPTSPPRGRGDGPGRVAAGDHAVEPGARAWFR